jgi:hypothetical protein
LPGHDDGGGPNRKGGGTNGRVGNWPSSIDKNDRYDAAMSFEANFRLDLGPRASITAVRDELLNFSRVITFARRVEAAVWKAEHRARPASTVEVKSIDYNNPLDLKVEGVADIVPGIIRAVATVGPTYRAAKAGADEAEIRRDALVAKEADGARLRAMLLDEIERRLRNGNRATPTEAIAALLDDNLTEALEHLTANDVEIDVDSQ